MHSYTLHVQTAKVYRENAQECRKLAKSARDENERRALLQMAETWESLANSRVASTPRETATNGANDQGRLT